MVSALSKLANPWKCDAPGCGQLRAKDTNHWLMLGVHRDSEDDKEPFVMIAAWDDAYADVEGVKHACGVPCGLKLAAQLVMSTFFPAEISLGEEANGD